MPETLYLTTFLIDRYISTLKVETTKNQLHLLGVAALLISTKYEEVCCPKIKDLQKVSENKFTHAQIVAMEFEILLALQFDLTTPSAYRFLEWFHQMSLRSGGGIFDDQIFFFAQYIQELTLLEGSLLKYNPSEIAAAALILSNKSQRNINIWTSQME